MSFPHTIYGSYGTEKVVDATKKYSYGQRLELPDGRIFRYAKAGATALVAGKLYQGASGNISTDTMMVDSLVCSTAAVGSRSITLTASGTTAIAAGSFDDGYMFTSSSANGGVGEVLKIKTAATGATGATFLVEFAEGDQLNTATEGGTTKVGIRQNLYNVLEIVPATTVGVNAYAGVAPVAIPASSFGWIQRRGTSTYYSESATLAAVGAPMAAAHSFAGALDKWIGVTSSVTVVGFCMAAAATSKRFGLVDLTIE